MRRGEIRWYTFRLPDKRRPVMILTRNEVIGSLNELWSCFLLTDDTFKLLSDGRLQLSSDESHLQGERHLRDPGALAAQGVHRRSPGDEGLPVADDRGQSTGPWWGTLTGQACDLARLRLN